MGISAALLRDPIDVEWKWFVGHIQRDIVSGSDCDHLASEAGVGKQLIVFRPNVIGNGWGHFAEWDYKTFVLGEMMCQNLGLGFLQNFP